VVSEGVVVLHAHLLAFLGDRKPIPMNVRHRLITNVRPKEFSATARILRSPRRHRFPVAKHAAAIIRCAGQLCVICVISYRTIGRQVSSCSSSELGSVRVREPANGLRGGDSFPSIHCSHPLVTKSGNSNPDGQLSNQIRASPTRIMCICCTYMRSRNLTGKKPESLSLSVAGTKAGNHHTRPRDQNAYTWHTS